MSQSISIAAEIFKDIGKMDEIPNTLYSLYETKYDVKVMKVLERLRAVSARPTEAKLLNLEPGSPVMEVDRTAIAIDGRHVEWRLSYVNTTDHHYLSKLT